MKTQDHSIKTLIQAIIFSLLIVLISTQCTLRNCAKCNSDRSYCFACSDNYEQNFLNQCINPPIANCNFFDDQNRCLRCNPTFRPMQNQTRCQKDYSGCLYFDNFGNCNECGFSTSLIQNNQCSGVINCDQFSLNSCKKCKTGYQPRNGLCFDISNGCNSINQTNGLCISCKPGYNLIGFTCIQNSVTAPLCFIYDSSGKCMNCKGNLLNVDGKCLTIQQRDSGVTSGSQTVITNQNQFSSSGSNLSQNNNDNFFTADSFNSGFGSFDFGGFGGTTTTATSSNSNTSGGNASTSSTSTSTSTTSTSTSSTSSSSSSTGFNSNGFGSDGFSNTGFSNNGFNTNGFSNDGFSDSFSSSNNNGFSSGFDSNSFTSGSNNQGSSSGGTTTTTTTTTTTNTNTVAQGGQQNIIGGLSGFDSDFVGSGSTGFGGDLGNNFNSGFGNSFGGDTQNTTQTVVIQNCEIYDPANPKICVKCSDKFYPSSPNKNSCLPVSPFCDGYNIQTGDCIKCLYGLNLQNGACKDLNCQSFNDKTCTQCPTSYIIDYNLNICLYLDPRCLQFNINKVCIECRDGYYLNSQNRCAPVPSNCKDVNKSTGECLQCLEGYQLIGGTCEQKIQIAHCLSIRRQERICVFCEDRYFVANNGNSCQQVSPYCGQYNQLNGVCLTCKFASHLISQIGECYDPNCLTPSKNQVRCTQCKQGYLYSQVISICAKIPQNIIQNCQSKTPDNNQRCQKCTSGFYVNSQFKCSKLPANCQLANPSGICIKCIQGYFTSSTNQCLQKITLPNCKTVDQNSKTCIQCNDNFIKRNNQCFQKSNLCSEYSLSSGFCLICRSGYYLNAQSNCVALPENCSKADSAGKCTNCLPNFSIFGNACVKSIENCENFDNPNQCKKCFIGWYINSVGQCTTLPVNCVNASVIGYCIQCSTGYYSNNAGQCQQNYPNCQKMGGNGFCQLCSSGFYINNEGRCSALSNGCLQALPSGFCRSCQNNFILNQQQGTCQQQIQVQNCQIATSGGQCSRCASSFYVNAQGTCSKLPQNCLFADPSGLCQQCATGYKLVAPNCLQEIPNCQIIVQEGICFKCFGGFYINLNGKCATLPQNCQNALPSGFCQTCASGYQISPSGSCNAKQISIPNCLTISPQGTCSVCNNGWFINSSGACQTLPNNCMKAFPTGSCQQCMVGFYVSSSGNCQRNLQNCDVMNAIGFCQICAQQFYQSTDGGCRRLPQGCQNALPSGFCQTCSPSYSLTAQGSCTRQISIANCENSNQNICLKCVTGYYINLSNSCSILPTNCNSAQPSGACNQCQTGFILNDGKCIKNIENCINLSNVGSCLQCLSNFYINSQGLCASLPNNCLSASGNGICTACVQRFYLNIDNLCVGLPANCNAASPNGICQICAAGFSVNAQGLCVQQTIIANCFQKSNNICIQCNQGYYLNSNQGCSILPNNCLRAATSGLCIQCNSGFTLDSSQICIFRSTSIITTQTTIQFCETYGNGTCTRCQNRYFPIFGNLFCARVPDYCQSYNLFTGVCTNCQPGLTLLQVGVCANITVTDGRDPNCLQYDRNSICQRCSNRYYFSEIGKCIPGNPLCKAINVYGQCTQCYQGYTYGEGFCILKIQSTQTTQNDPNCKISKQNICSECYPGYYYNSGRGSCQRSNPLCRTTNSNGGCTGCYPSYELVGEECSNSFNRDPYCNTYDSSQNCVECAVRYFKDPNTGNKCSPVNILCRSYSKTNGKCTECYQGYSLVNTVQIQQNNKAVITGLCEVGTPQTSSDPNCKNFADSAKTRCQQCYQGFIALSGKCGEINPLCKAVNYTNGYCTQCYYGYNLFQGNCVILSEQPGNSALNDPYCIKIQNSICMECSKGFFFNQTSQLCTILDPYCKTHNLTTGACLSCYQGFEISGTKCVIFGTVSVGVSQPQQPTIQNCEQYQNSQCIRCYPRYYYNKNSVKCEPVSNACLDYNQSTGECKTCISGYYFQDNSCVQVGFFDQNCIRYTNAYCSSCRAGYYVNSYYCELVDPNCQQFDYTRKICTICFGQYTPLGAKCRAP